MRRFLGYGIYGGAFTGKSIIRNYEILRFENILVEQSLGIPLCIIVAVFFLIIGGIHCPKEREKKYYRKEKEKDIHMDYFIMK